MHNTVIVPETIKRKGLSVQVCVPADWTDEEVKSFADRDTLCGTESGWHIDHGLGRVNCGERVGCVHVVLHA